METKPKKRWKNVTMMPMHPIAPSDETQRFDRNGRRRGAGTLDDLHWDVVNRSARLKAICKRVG